MQFSLKIKLIAKRKSLQSCWPGVVVLVLLQFFSGWLMQELQGFTQTEGFYQLSVSYLFKIILLHFCLW